MSSESINSKIVPSKILEDALATVKLQGFHLKKCLDSHRLMESLKHATTMVSELKTSELSPKAYYDLYMAIFDHLRYLTQYLYDAHISKRHHLSDLYELVQYSGSIIPRLYLMITVGAVYMRVSKNVAPSIQPATNLDDFPKDIVDQDKLSNLLGDTQSGAASLKSELFEDIKVHPTPSLPDDIPPVKELMKDMLEMSRGVQHPTRGLFLRYYLSAVTRDFLPDGSIDGPHGDINDSIEFILGNFIEMNKLWVRLQHQGLSKDKERRERERKELRLLVGSSLVRLSELEGLTLAVFKTMVLPSLLEEVVGCCDYIAQEYLMEVIIQVFQDEYHLHTLDSFLAIISQLESAVNVKQIVISIVDRFAKYAVRLKDDSEKKIGSGIPESINLFDIFWGKVTELVKLRPEFKLSDTISLLVSLCGLSLNCYPETLSNIDEIFHFARDLLLQSAENIPATMQDPLTITAFQHLLLLPISAYSHNILIFLEFPSSSVNNINGSDVSTLGGNYSDVLFMQPFSTRTAISEAFVKIALTAIHTGFRITSAEGVNFLFGEVCGCAVRDQEDGSLLDENADWENISNEQSRVSKLVHLIGREDAEKLDNDFMLLSIARKHLAEGGQVRIRFTFTSLIVEAVKLAAQYGSLRATLTDDDERDRVGLKMRSLYMFIHQTISALSKAPETQVESVLQPAIKDFGAGLMRPAEISIRLFLLASQSAEKNRLEDAAYEFLVQVFTLYEDFISDSKAQFSSLCLVISTLQVSTVFGYENLETLITKCVVHCSRLLKRADQCRGLLMASHLFYADDERTEEGTLTYRDGRRVLECLQKALKIADSVMDANGNIELLVEILEKYLWYFERKIETINANYITSLIELIQTNISNLSESISGGAKPIAVSGVLVGKKGIHHHPIDLGPLSQNGSNSSLFETSVFGSGKENTKIAEFVIKHFINILAFIKSKQNDDSRWRDILV